MSQENAVRHSKVSGRLFLAMNAVTEVLRDFEETQSDDLKSRDAWMLCLGTLASQFDLIMTIESLEDRGADEALQLEKLHADALDLLKLVEGLIPELV